VKVEHASRKEHPKPTFQKITVIRNDESDDYNTKNEVSVELQAKLIN